MEFVIEKGVPIPAKGTIRDGFSDILRKLEIGDSFLAPKGKRNQLTTLQKQLGIKLTARMESNERIRIWRIA